MKNLQCEHPAIILNRNAKRFILLHGNYVIRGSLYVLTSLEKSLWSYDFPYRKIGTKSNVITHDDIDSCYIIDHSTGDLIPLYIEVPCGKCILCRDKKVRDWSTRAMCESQTSDSFPLFITLTYEDTFLPDSVCKEHCQSFMKRLRINTQRYFNMNVNLRFFLCSEYGRKHGRPHYHLLLWNFPSHRFDNLKQAYELVRKSWSFVIPKKDLDKYDKQLVFHDEFANRYRVQFGFVHLQMAQGSHVKYCMKYMRKDGIIPDGCADSFYLCSRKRGIGYEWFAKHRDEMVNNPHYNEVQFTDVWSCAKFKAAVPQYFRQLMFPCISRVLPKDIRVKYAQYIYFINVRNSMIGKKYYYTPEKRITEKYKPIEEYVVDIPVARYFLSYLKELDEDYAYYVRVLSSDGHLIDIHRVSVISPDSRDEKLNILFKGIVNKIDSLERELKEYSFDVKAYDLNQQFKFAHQFNLAKIMDSKNEVSIKDRKSDLYRRRQTQINRELAMSVPF